MRSGVGRCGRAAGAPRGRQSQGIKEGGRDGQNLCPSVRRVELQGADSEGMRRWGGEGRGWRRGFCCWQLRMGQRRRRQAGIAGREAGELPCLAQAPLLLKRALHTHAHRAAA